MSTKKACSSSASGMTMSEPADSSDGVPYLDELAMPGSFTVSQVTIFFSILVLTPPMTLSSVKDRMEKQTFSSLLSIWRSNQSPSLPELRTSAMTSVTGRPRSSLPGVSIRRRMW
ncbi:hypothetical protein D3C73_1257140 [compost metagenome]